jgi:hypothetical protein
MGKLKKLKLPLANPQENEEKASRFGCFLLDIYPRLISADRADE